MSARCDKSFSTSSSETDVVLPNPFASGKNESYSLNQYAGSESGKVTTNQSALVGFAVLRANYNADAPNYIDNFTNFAVEVLVRSHPDPLDSHSGSEQIRASFGLTIPDFVVEKIFHSAVRLNMATGSRGLYTASTKALKRSGSISADLQRYTRQQIELATKLSGFIERSFPEHASLLDADLSEQLGLYFQANAIPLLAQSLRGTIAKQPAPGPGFEYLISRFIAELAETDQTAFSYVEDAAKGAILAAVVELDTSSFSQSLKSLAIYLDAPVLIDLLGFHGHISADAMTQFVLLARKLGATVCVFEHSVREVEGILHTAESFLKGSGRGQLPRTVLHFQDSGMSPVDVALAREKLPELIRDAGVKTKERPGDYAKFGLDEVALEDLLQKSIGYRMDSARRNDVDSISAIHRLRSGGSTNKLERAGSVFVTNNTELARVAAKTEADRHHWPMVMTEVALASLMWIRSPAVDANLPRTFLLAAAYAGMQPDGRLWLKYIDEVEALEKRGAVDPADAILLRTSSVAKSALMEESLGIADSTITADGVLRRMRDDIARPLEKAAAESEFRATAARIETERVLAATREAASALKALSAREQASLIERRKRDEKIDADANRRGKQAVIALVLSLAVVLGAISMATSLIDDVWPWVKLASGLAGGILVLLAVITSLLPATLSEGIATPIQRRVSKRYSRKVRMAAGLPEAVQSSDIKR